MNNDKKILLFQVKKDKISQIRTLCDRLNVRTVLVSPAEYSLTLGKLAGIKDCGPVNAAGAQLPAPGPLLPGVGVPQMEMMVFSGISSDLLDTFLAEYKKEAIEPIPLKAVVTPFNIHWDVRTLYNELLKEHMSL